MSGFNSYRLFRKQFSADKGLNWENVDPPVVESRYITTFNDLDDCLTDLYKAVYFMADGRTIYVPCDGDDTLSGMMGSELISLLVVGKCVRSIRGGFHLRRLQLPEDGILERIEDGAFSNAGLGYDTFGYMQRIPDTVKYIGVDAFDCNEVSNYTIGTGITYIGDGAFRRGGGPDGRNLPRLFEFKGETPPEFACGSGRIFQDVRGGKTYIKVPCGTEWTYYNAICRANYDGAARNTIYSTVDDECNHRAFIYNFCSTKDTFDVIPVSASTILPYVASTNTVKDVIIEDRPDTKSLDLCLGGSDLNSMVIPSCITEIRRLLGFSIDKLFLPPSITKIDQFGGGGGLIFYADYFEFGFGTEDMTINPRPSISAECVTCRMGNSGNFGGYGIQLTTTNFIIENTKPLSLSNVVKNHKITNLYVLPEMYSHYSGQTDHFDNIYVIGDQTGTTWVASDREYLYDEDNDVYYYKEYERKDFENGMSYYTQNYRAGSPIAPRPYYANRCNETIVDEDTGIEYQAEEKILKIGNREIPLYEKRRGDFIRAYQIRWYNGNNSDGIVCSGQTEINNSMIKNPASAATSFIIYDNCCTSIADNTFQGLGFQSIRISDNVTNIGQSAFYHCMGLSNINIPTGITEIKNSTFSYCWNLKDITIPSNVTRIGDNAFGDCRSLRSITIPDSVTSLGVTPFSSCDALATASVGSGITTINNIFAYCENLSSITLSDNATTIADRAFKGLFGLKSVRMNGVTSIGSEAFSGCTGIESVGPVGSGAGIQISNTVESIGEKVFEGCTGIKSVELGNEVLSNCPHAFYNCTGIKNITIDNDVTSLGDYVFRGCKGLNELNIPDNVATIGVSAFDGCSGMTACTFGSGLTTIGRAAFWGCRSLEDIVIPSGVTSIGSGAFNDCGDLYSVTIESNSIMSKTYTYNSNINNMFDSQVKKYIIGDNVTSIGGYAFYNGGNIPEVVLGNSIASIGRFAFYSCENITKINFPASVNSIGEYAFYRCYNITNADLPNVINIGQLAFYSCRNLSSITMSNVVTIGNRAFYDCRKLRSVNIPDSITSIGPSAFQECGGLSSVTIGSGITSIGDKAFSGCPLQSITVLAETPPTLGNNVLYGTNNCPIYVPEDSVNAYKTASRWSSYSDRINPMKIRYSSGTPYCVDCTKYVDINTEASYDSGETWVTLTTTPSVVEKVSSDCGCIERWVINPGEYECSGTTKVSQEKQQESGDGGLTWTDVIPLTTRPSLPVIEYESVECGYIPPKVILTLNDSSVVKIECDSTSAITNSNISPYQSTLVSAEITDCVTRIDYEAFYGCSGMTSIIIPSCITYFDYRAFTNCSSLTGITIPSGVTSIGGGVFENCSGLTSIDLPDSVTEIGGSAFDGCSGLTDVNIPSGVTRIENYTFRNCVSLTSIDIPSGVTYIGWYAFQKCSGLTSIVIPDSVTSIEDMVFWGCSNLRSINIPSGITTISNGLLQDCTSLSSVTIPNSVTSIGYQAFYNCRSLTSIDIPSGVTSIGNWAFSSCSGLRSIEIPNSVTSIGNYAFGSCHGLTSVTIPDSVTSIEDSTFGNCTGLTTVNIPNSVTSIGSYAFEYCRSLTSITIGSDCTSIGNSAFNRCTSLNSVTVNATTPPTLGTDAFGITNDCPIYVPSASVNAYKAASGWSSYSDRINPIQ